MDAYLLAMTWFSIFTLRSMNKCRLFCVKTMQPIWLFIHKSIVLWHELPADFRWNDIAMDGRGTCAGRCAGGWSCVCHPGMESELFHSNLMNAEIHTGIREEPKKVELELYMEMDGRSTMTGIWCQTWL